jgi:hypothetical protein
MSKGKIQAKEGKYAKMIRTVRNEYRRIRTPELMGGGGRDLIFLEVEGEIF